MDPARAGMILSAFTSRILEKSGPRASGDDPTIGELTDGMLEWTPRERG